MSKAGPWALSPAERMLPGRRTRQVQLHLNIQTHDFLRHSEVRNLKNDITVRSYLVLFLNQIHKTEQICRNTHTQMRQMHRGDSLGDKGRVASEAALALCLKIDENVLLFYG